MLDVFEILRIGIFWRTETLIGITFTLFFNGGSFQGRKQPNQNRSRETIMPSHVSPRRSCIGLTAILPSCFQIHSLPPWTAATKIGTQGRKTGKNGAGEENRASGNFSRAKYHADWLEVMKFWWLIKCKKIYRLRPSALPFLLFFSSWSPSPASRASFLLHFSFVSRSFRGAAGFAKWTEERLKGAKGDVGVKFKTPGNRLGTLEESTTNCTPASLFLCLRLGPLSNPRESHFPRLNVPFHGKIPLYSQKHCYSIDENVDFVDFNYPDGSQMNVWSRVINFCMWTEVLDTACHLRDGLVSISDPPRFFYRWLNCCRLIDINEHQSSNIDNYWWSVLKLVMGSKF